MFSHLQNLDSFQNRVLQGGITSHAMKCGGIHPLRSWMKTQCGKSDVLQSVRSCTSTCNTSKYMIFHVFGAHACARCIIVAKFFLLCRSISTVCSFCCWVRHYDRKISPDEMEHIVHTFESLSPESYTGMRIAKEHVHVLHSALSLCTILRRIV